MSIILNISGTNGAGKTTLVRSLTGPAYNPVDLCRYLDKKERTKTVEGVAGNGIIAVGPYRPGVASGGCDGVPTQDLVRKATEAAVLKFPDCHVIFEGVVVSTIFQRYHDWAKEEGVDLRFGYLDTPLEVCLANIRKRQEASGKVREIKTDQVEGKWKSIRRRRNKMIEAGLLVYDIPHGSDAKGSVLDIFSGTQGNETSVTGDV